MPAVEAFTAPPQYFAPPRIEAPQPYEPTMQIPVMPSLPSEVPLGFELPEPGEAAPSILDRIMASPIGPYVGEAVQRYGFPALEWFQREAVERLRRGLRPLQAFPTEEVPPLPEAAAETALGVTWPLRLGLRALYEAPQVLQKEIMKEEYRERYIGPERGYTYLTPQVAPGGFLMLPPTPEMYERGLGEEITEEQVRELQTAWQVGEYYPTLLRRPQMRQKAFDMIQAGATAEEIKNTPGMYDFWSEFVGDTITDPAWLIPAAAMEKVFPLGELLGVVGRALKRTPVIGSLFRVTRVHKLRQFVYSADDALRQFLLHTQADESLVGRFARLLAGDESVLTPMGPRLRTSMEAVRDMFLGRDRELRGLGERYPPAYLSGLRADERMSTMTQMLDEAGEGLFRVLERFVDPEEVEKMAVGEFTDEDLLYWIRQAVSRAKRNELGLIPRKGAIGKVGRFFGTLARLLREGLIAPNIAFHQINMVDSLFWMILDLQFPNILDAPLINRIARRFGRPEMVDDLTRRFAELGLPFPSKLRQPYVGTLIGGEPLERPRLLWHKIPFVGKPMALVEGLEWLTGKPLSQIARQSATAEGVPWPKRKVGQFIVGLMEDQGRLARFLNRLNISSAMQLITDEAQTELWVRSQTVAQEIFPGTDRTRLEMANRLKNALLDGGASEEMAHSVWMDVSNPNKVANVLDLDNYLTRLKDQWAPRLGSYEMVYPRSMATDNDLIREGMERLDEFAAKPGTREELDGIFTVMETDARKREAEVLVSLAPEQLEIGELRRLGVRERDLRGLSDDVALAKLVGDKKVRDVERKWFTIFERIGEAEGFKLEDVRFLASDIGERARIEAIDPWLDDLGKLRLKGRETGNWDEVLPQIRAGWERARSEQARLVDRYYLDYMMDNLSLPELNRLLSGDPRYLGVPEAVELAALEEDIIGLAERPWDSGLKADLDALEVALAETQAKKAYELAQLETQLQEITQRPWRPELKKEIRSLERRIRSLRTSIDVGPTGEVVARSAGEYAEMAARGYELTQELDALRAASERLPPAKTVFRVWDYREGEMRKVLLPDGRRVEPWWEPTIAKQIQEAGYEDFHDWVDAVEEAVRVRGRIAELKEILKFTPEVELPTTAGGLKEFITRSEGDLERMMAEGASPEEFNYALSIYEDAMKAYKEVVPETIVLVNEKGELTLAGKQQLENLRSTYDNLMSREPYLSAKARNEARKIEREMRMLERGAFGLPRAEEIMEGKRSIISLLQEEALDEIGRRDEVTVRNAQELLRQNLEEIAALKAAAFEQYEPIRLWAQEGIWMTPEEMAEAANQLGMWKAGPWLERAWNKHVGDPSGIPTSMDDLRRLFDEDPARVKRWQDYLFKKIGQADLPLYKEWSGRAVSYPGGATPIANFDEIQREAVKFMADGYEAALDRGLAEVGRRFFDYTEEYGFDAFLKGWSPFHLFLTRNIVRYPKEMARRPALLNMVRRIPEGSMRFVNQYNLTGRFRGAVPLPLQPLQDADYYIDQGVLPPMGHGYMYAVDTSNFFAIFGEVPLIYGSDDLPWGWEDETWQGKVARSTELFGLSVYPWWRIPMDMLLGTHKGLPSQDLTYMTRVVKQATGVDIEDPLDWYKTQYDETAIAEYYANLRLLDYLYYYLEDGILVDGVRVDLERFQDAANNPDDPLFQRALGEVKEYHAKLSLARCFEPFGVKSVSPAELKARQLVQAYNSERGLGDLEAYPLLLAYWSMFDEPHEAEMQRLRNQYQRDLDSQNMVFAAVAAQVTPGTKEWEDMEAGFWKGRDELEAKYESIWADRRQRYIEGGVSEDELPAKFGFIPRPSRRMVDPLNRTISSWLNMTKYWQEQIYDADFNVVNADLFPDYIRAREGFLNRLESAAGGIPTLGYAPRHEFERWLHRYDSPEEAILSAWEELYARPAGEVIYAEIPEEVSDEERERLQAEKNEKESWANAGRGDFVGLMRRVLYWHPDWTPAEIARAKTVTERLPEWDTWSRRNEDLRGALTGIIWNCYMSGYVQTGSPFFEWIAEVEDENTADAFRLFFVDRDRRNINDVSTRTLLLVADRLGGLVELATEGFDREIIEAAKEYGEEELADEVMRYMRRRPDLAQAIMGRRPVMAPPAFGKAGLEKILGPEIPTDATISPWVGQIREQLDIAEEEEEPLDIPDYDAERVIATIIKLESNGDPEAENHFTYKGEHYTAAGLGQVVAEFTPYTVEQLKEDPSLNIRESIRDLYDKLLAAGGDLKVAYFNYSGGLDAWGSMEAFEPVWERFQEVYDGYYAPADIREVAEIEEARDDREARERRLRAIEQGEVEVAAAEGIPPGETRRSLRGEVYAYLTDEEAESYADARKWLDEYWKAREAGDDEVARNIWEANELEDWFGDPDSGGSQFWNWWWTRIPPGWRSGEIKADPIVAFVLDKGMRDIEHGGEPMVGDPMYLEALKRIRQWWMANRENLGDPTEYEQARAEQKEYQELFFTPEYQAYLDMSREEREKYRKQNPWIYEHWDAMRAWREEHPMYSKYYVREEYGPGRGRFGGGGGGFRGRAPSPRIRSWEDFDRQLKRVARRRYELVMEELRSYWTARAPFSDEVKGILMQLYRLLAYGGVSFKEWLAIIHEYYRRRTTGGGYRARRPPVTWRIPRY